MVAAMGREVVAVDAMADNLAYIRASLEVGNNTDKVVLGHQAIIHSVIIHTSYYLFIQQRP